MPIEFSWKKNRADDPPKVYRGVFGYNAQLKIDSVCRRKGVRPVFPDCKTLI